MNDSFQVVHCIVSGLVSIYLNQSINQSLINQLMLLIYFPPCKLLKDSLYNEMVTSFMWGRLAPIQLTTCFSPFPYIK